MAAEAGVTMLGRRGGTAAGGGGAGHPGVRFGCRREAGIERDWRRGTDVRRGRLGHGGQAGIRQVELGRRWGAIIWRVRLGRGGTGGWRARLGHGGTGIRPIQLG